MLWRLHYVQWSIKKCWSTLNFVLRKKIVIVLSGWPPEKHKIVNNKHSHMHCIENEAKHIERPAMTGSFTFLF